MDAALNNRQASNPYEPSKNNPHRLLYPPTGLVAYTGYQTLKLTWTAPDSDQHLRYEIKITNTETGVSETKSTYTNELKYKNVNGSYTATVKSVGRDGSSSAIQTITFHMGGSLMQIEGNKNGPTSLGTMVQDQITLYNGYSIYAWGSVVLDKYIAGSSNEPAVFRLWSMEGANQTFDADVAELQQTITLYPATESFANLDDQAHGAGIERPVPVGTSRPGSFETSQSVMFSPISVNTTEESVTFTFFLQALGRTVEQDEVNLSLVLWGGFDGLGDNIPQDPWSPSEYVFPHLNSLRLWRRAMNSSSPYDTVTEGSWYLAQQPKEFNIIDNSWTIAFWVRLESEHVTPMLLMNTEENGKLAAINTIFARSSYNAGGTAWKENAIEITLIAIKDAQGLLYQYVDASVWDASGSAIDIQARFNNQTFGDHNPPDEDDQSYLWGQVGDHQNNNWQFYVICFEGGPQGADGEPGEGTDLTPKLRVYCNNRLVDPAAEEDRYIPPNRMCCLNQRVADGAVGTKQTNPAHLLKEINQDLTNDYVYSLGIAGGAQPLYNVGVYHGDDRKVNNGTFTIHQMGMWNIALDNWDGMGFNPGVAEQRDSSPWYAVPYNLTGGVPDKNPTHTDGRHNPFFGSSLTAIHYLFNQGYGTDIDWKKNSNIRIDGAREYIFAENLIHLWQFGAIADEYSTTARTLRDTGNHLLNGGINFLRTITSGTAPGKSSNAWSEDCKLSDIVSATRMWFGDYYLDATQAIKDKLPPIEYKATDGRPNWTDQVGIIQPAGHLNGAGYPDAGTTAIHAAYPGWGHVAFEATTGGGPLGKTVGWRRPNTTNGVLDEPKTYGPVYAAWSLGTDTLPDGPFSSETLTGQSPWP
jgi:hypothetical protein